MEQGLDSRQQKVNDQIKGVLKVVADTSLIIKFPHLEGYDEVALKSWLEMNGIAYEVIAEEGNVDE